MHKVRDYFMARSNIIVFVLCMFGMSQALAAEPFHWGINGHPLTQPPYINIPIATQLDLVSELGVGWYRFDVPAGILNSPEGLARFDDLVKEAETRKIQLLPVLFSTPGPGSKGVTPEQIHAAAFAIAKGIVRRYKNEISHWELNNELDIYAMIQKGEILRSGKLWNLGSPGGSDPEAYEEGRYQNAKADILGLYEGVKAADPKALTIVNTGGWIHYGFIERLVNEDHVPFDILSWHWYSEMGDITKVKGSLNLVEYLKRYHKPLWITETNLRDGNHKEKEQAEYMTKDVAKMGANAGIQGLFIYELLDEPYFGENNGESHFGLVAVTKDRQGKWQVSRRKPAFEAYQSVVASSPIR